MKRSISLLMALWLLVAAALPAWAEGNPEAAATWLQAQVQADGGVSDGFSEGSSLSATTDAVYAAAATGQDVSAWGEEASPLVYLMAQAKDAKTTGDFAKLTLAAVATRQDPATFGGVNLIEQLNAPYDADKGVWAGTVTEHAFAILALHAAGQEVPAKASEMLAGLQSEEGGWSFDGTGQPDTNTTGLAMQALAAAGEPADSEPMTRALEFLKSQQNDDGGFPYQTPSDYGTESDANSTAWALQGLLAAGAELSDWNNPDVFLASLQMEDGAFQWKANVEGANFLATAQAIPALAGVTFVALPSVAASNAPTAAVQPAATPGTLPATGTRTPWEAVAAAGALLLLGGATLRRAA